MYTESVIFSCDKPHDLHQYAKFLRLLSNGVAAGVVKDGIQLCIGSYEGKLEPAFLMSRKDFDSYVMTVLPHYLKEQDTILRVPGDTKQSCVVEEIDTGNTYTLSAMKKSKVPSYNWTYVFETGEYWSC